MDRDDWKYYEEMGEEEETGAALPTEKQCVNCLHSVPYESPYCPWCGKQFPEPGIPPAKKG